MHIDRDSDNKVAKELNFAVSTQNRWVNNYLTTCTFGPINLKNSNYVIDEHTDFKLVLSDEKLDISLEAIQLQLDKDRDFSCCLSTISQFLDRQGFSRPRNAADLPRKGAIGTGPIGEGTRVIS